MTTIKGAFSNRVLEVWRNGHHPSVGPVVGVKVSGAPPDGGVNVTRADFLVAVEAELGVFIVPDDGRTVSQLGVELKSGVAHARTTDLPQWHEDLAQHHLAIARHLREHPPADEAEVTRIVAALAKTGGPGRVSLDAMARDLHAQGVRVTEVTP